jgi:hypothetical protein
VSVRLSMRTTNSRRDSVGRGRWRRTLTVLVAGTLAGPLSVAAGAQDFSPPAPRMPRPWTIGAYVGISRHSPVGIWGLTPDREHVLVGLHATIPIVRRPRWMFAYAPEAIPLIVVSDNPTSEAPRTAGAPPREAIEGSRAAVAGVGIAPIGLEVQVDATKRFAVYGAGAMGGLWFTRPIPVVDARAFNFTFDFGGGVLVRLTNRTRLRAGYKFHHLSNAKTAPSNPGVDAKVFLVGLDRQFGS